MTTRNVCKEASEFIKLSQSTLWMTGLPCSGKTTLALRLKEELNKLGFRAVHLDADIIRQDLNADLGFSLKDRRENIRRIACVAKLFNENGNLVIASFVCPTDELRLLAKEIIPNFRLVFVKCGLDTCQKRDVKGMYKKARAGQIKEFTGISSPFDEPKEADMIIDTESNNIDDCVKEILDKFKNH